MNPSRRVAVLGGVRIPFCKNNSAYWDVGNLGMSIKTLGALVEKFGLQGEVLGRLPGRRCHRSDAILERGDPLLEHRHGRVHDARVDVPEPLQREEVRRVLGVLEDVRARLVDRHRAAAGDGIGTLAGVDGEGLEAVLPVFLHGSGC